MSNFNFNKIYKTISEANVALVAASSAIVMARNTARLNDDLLGQEENQDEGQLVIRQLTSGGFVIRIEEGEEY